MIDVPPGGNGLPTLPHGRNSLARVMAGTTLALTAVLAAGWGIYTSHMNAMLLRSDPDKISATPGLFRYGVDRGRSVYRSHCLACHRGGGSGDPGRGVPTLSDDDWLYGTGSVGDIERIVTYGIRSNDPKAWNLAVMPAFGTPHPSQSNTSIPPLSPGQIRDVIEFLVQKQGLQAEAGAAARGARVYQSVGACYDCHSPDAKGDNAIGAPDLADRIVLYGSGDRDSLYDSIANGRQGICPSWIGRLSAASIREVALFVYALSHPAHSLRARPQ